MQLWIVSSHISPVDPSLFTDMLGPAFSSCAPLFLLFVSPVIDYSIYILWGKACPDIILIFIAKRMMQLYVPIRPGTTDVSFTVSCLNVKKQKLKEMAPFGPSPSSINDPLSSLGVKEENLGVIF